MPYSSPAPLPAWPPSSLTPAQLSHLAHLATDYALSHGIVYRPLAPASTAANPHPSPPYDSVIHAPFSLLPSPFPRVLFDYAQSLQPTYDVLYASLAASPAFLSDVIGGSVSKVDAFQASLWQIYQQVQRQPSRQKVGLGLFRSDYLLHRPEDAQSTQQQQGELTIKQVEFNTISASFGALCTKVAQMHRYLARNSAGYFGAHDGKLGDEANVPRNEALDVLAGGLAAGHREYLAQRRLSTKEEEGTAAVASSPVVLFVVQQHERNAFDQRWIESTLSQDHGVGVIRQTFAELHTSASVRGDEGRLYVVPPYGGEAVEVSVVYYRAGYGPADYPSQAEWELRLRIEQSLAIKCPTVALQLAGAKKVQQVLAEPGVTERVLRDEKKTGGKVVSEQEVEAVRASFTDLYPLDGSVLGERAYRLVLERPERFVMKPQREGGGNNVYRHDIPVALERMDKEDEERSLQGKGAEGVKTREGYILMSLIQPPKGLGNWLVKANTAGTPDKAGVQPAVLASDVVSELGVYGAILYRDGEEEGQVEVVHHKAGGFLLRTKARESDEGGVAVGFSVIDCPVLI
ncbi:Glutathione synthetase [Thecaphora frezii]